MKAQRYLCGFATAGGVIVSPCVHPTRSSPIASVCKDGHVKGGWTCDVSDATSDNHCRPRTRVLHGEAASMGALDTLRVGRNPPSAWHGTFWYLEVLWPQTARAGVQEAIGYARVWLGVQSRRSHEFQGCPRTTRRTVNCAATLEEATCSGRDPHGTARPQAGRLRKRRIGDPRS